MGNLLERLADTVAFFIVGPAVVVAAEAALLNHTVAEVRAAVRAVAVYHTVGARFVSVEHQVFTHKAHLFGRVLLQLLSSSNGLPVASHEVAHGCARADLC